MIEFFKKLTPNIYNFLHSETGTGIVFPIINRLAMILICAAFIWMTYLIIKSGIVTRQLKKASSAALTNMHSGMITSKVNFLNYSSLERFIKETGLEYMFGKAFDPIMFMGINIILALVGFFIGFQIRAIVSIPVAVLGFFLLTIIGLLNNSSDNSSLLEDVKSIYDTLRIQTKAGVFLTTAISECYLTVRNKRLKQALIELSNDLVVKNDIISAADEFQGKFKNSYVDSLAIILKQSTESGRAAQMFDDISGQIDDIQQALNIREKEKISHQIVITQVFIYASILGVTMYSFITQMGSELF